MASVFLGIFYHILIYLFFKCDLPVVCWECMFTENLFLKTLQQNVSLTFTFEENVFLKVFIQFDTH